MPLEAFDDWREFGIERQNLYTITFGENSEEVAKEIFIQSVFELQKEQSDEKGLELVCKAIKIQKVQANNNIESVQFFTDMHEVKSKFRLKQ